jgi:hypothetical protein
MKYTKLCNKCQSIQTYSNFGNYNRAVKNNTLCRKCNNKEVSLETRQKISKSSIGKPKSKEAVEKMKNTLIELWRNKTDIEMMNWKENVSKTSLNRWKNDEYREKVSNIAEKEKAIKPNICIQFEEVNINTKDFKSPALLRDLKINNVLNTEMFYGEILEIDENNVYVYCMIDTGVFQERKFSKELFSHISGLKVNDYVSIVTKTNPGLLIVQVFEMKENLSHLFEKPNYFEGLENSAFFTQG